MKNKKKLLSATKSQMTSIANDINQIALDQNYDISHIHEYKKRRYKTIFSGHGINDGYAFHTGGRRETQFNIGFEKRDTGLIFRYGIAFSLARSQALQDPISVMSPRIRVFNEFLKANKKEFHFLKMWCGDETKDGRKIVNVGTIPNEWVKQGNFIFIGVCVSKKPNEITHSDLKKVLQVFDKLYKAYVFIEDRCNESIESVDRVSRICWNSNGWRSPTGKKGKSIDKNSYENKNGFGHEEWIFNFSYLYKGYKYAHLQSIGKHRESFIGKKFNVLLYAINTISNVERKYFWIGEIKNMEVIDFDSEDQVFSIFEKKGLIKSMRDDVGKINGKVNSFDKELNNYGFFNVRFKPEDVVTTFEAFDGSVVIPSKRYELIRRSGLSQKIPESMSYENNRFSISGTKIKSEKEVEKSAREYTEYQNSALHNIIQNALAKHLSEEFSNDTIDLESKTGFGTLIDCARLKKNGDKVYYEVKTYLSAKKCIREGVGQLLEYCHYPNRSEANELVIVSQNPLTSHDKSYLEKLQKLYKLPFKYLQYDEHRKLFV